MTAVVIAMLLAIVAVTLTAISVVTVALTYLLYSRDVMVSTNNKILYHKPFHNKLAEVCEHGAVHLVCGLFNYTGKLEFCAHGRWGEVCNIPQLWSPDNTKVVCRQLGFPEDGKEITVLYLICCTLGFKPIRRRTHSY